jgi:hypothetical protein
MQQPRFPRTREDGSITVAARFSVAEIATLRCVQDFVAGWLRGLTATGHVDLLEEMTVLPHVLATEPASIDVVFDGRSGSRRWKDWLVLLTRDLTTSLPELKFVGFCDLVSGTAHPASVEQFELDPEASTPIVRRVPPNPS